MKLVKMLALVAGLAMGFSFGDAPKAEAGYYTSWNYYPSHSYHYTSYYYTPTRYHYCIYYPSYPRYVYYYNPYSRSYWGRYDLEGKEGAQYSELAEADRKGKLADIPESAFPKAGPMPKNPDGTEGNIPVPPAVPAEKK
jgi:hypothetical protein